MRRNWVYITGASSTHAKYLYSDARDLEDGGVYTAVNYYARPILIACGLGHMWGKGNWSNPSKISDWFGGRELAPPVREGLRLT